MAVTAVIPPIHGQVGAGDEGRLVGEEEPDGFGRLVGDGHPLQGVRSSTCARIPGSSKTGSSTGVSTAPGQTALIRKPSPANRRAMDRITPSTSPLGAQ